MPFLPMPPRQEKNIRKVREQLIALRLERGMTQNQVGEMLNYNQNSISRLELGKYTDLRMSTLERWAHALGATLDIQVKVVSPPKRVDYHALKRAIRDAQLANPKTSEGARMQAESRARYAALVAHRRGYRSPRKETS